MVCQCRTPIWLSVTATWRCVAAAASSHFNSWNNSPSSRLHAPGTYTDFAFTAGVHVAMTWFRASDMLERA